MNLYFQLVGKAVSEEHRTLLSTIESKLKDTEYKLYMMKHLSHLLRPSQYSRTQGQEIGRLADYRGKSHSEQRIGRCQSPDLFR